MKTFQSQVASVVANAMQVAILAWNSPDVKSMTDETKAEFMAFITRTFVNQILDLANEKSAEESSS